VDTGARYILYPCSRPSTRPVSVDGQKMPAVYTPEHGPCYTARQHGPCSAVVWTGARVHGPCEHVFYVVIAVPPLSSSSTSSSVDNDLDSDVKGAFTVSSQLTPSRLLADDGLYVCGS